MRLTKAEFAAEYQRQFWATKEVDFPQLCKNLGCTMEQVTDLISRTKVMEELSIFHIPPLTHPSLSIKQIVWINALLNIHDNRSLRKKAEEFELTTMQHNAWMRNPKFANHLQTRAFELFGQEKYAVFLSVLKGAIAGDVSAQKLYLELTGDYRPNDHKVSVKVDIQATVSILIEIIQRHCSQDQILAISRDFSNALETPLAPYASPCIDVHEANAKETFSGALPNKEEPPVGSPSVPTNDEKWEL